MAECVRVKSKDMGVIVEAVERCILKKYGIHEKILSDNGKEFKNRMTEELANNYGFKWVFTSPYSPRTTGLVERFNGTFIRKLRKLCKFGALDWGEQLEKARQGYLNSYHRIIKCTPLEKSMIRQEENLPVQSKAGKISAKESRFMDWWSKLKVGDFVMFNDKSVSRDKLDPKYTHKGEILEKMFESARLKLNDGRIVVSNVRQLGFFL
jgi:hypothetical protein